MRTATALFFLFVSGIGATETSAAQTQALAGEQVTGVAQQATDETHLTLHNVRAAHRITMGEGIRVGILDHSFGASTHPELYAGGRRFLKDGLPPIAEPETHHGYWMALTLREIAPEAAIYALETHAQDEMTQVHAMVQALDWAVEQELDVVTYCGRALSELARRTLDPVVERTVEAGVVVVFLDYSHPLNLLPGGIGYRVDENSRDPDLSIFSYDCTTILADRFVALVEPDDDQIQRYRPFLGRPSTGSIAAGLVALLRSVDPEASPDAIKKTLMETSRSLDIRGQRAVRVPDVFEAVSSVVGI